MGDHNTRPGDNNEAPKLRDKLSLTDGFAGRAGAPGLCSERPKSAVGRKHRINRHSNFHVS